MRASFSGTRNGMTPAQRRAVEVFLGHLGPAEFHTGCCVGADHQAALIAAALRPRPAVVGHPGTGAALTSAVACGVSDPLHPPRPNLERNRAIVDSCDVLLAAPAGMVEELRSGTWATVRYAAKAGKRTVVFWPDGTITERDGR